MFLATGDWAGVSILSGASVEAVNEVIPESDAVSVWSDLASLSDGRIIE